MVKRCDLPPLQVHIAAQQATAAGAIYAQLIQKALLSCGTAWRRTSIVRSIARAVVRMERRGRQSDRCSAPAAQLVYMQVRKKAAVQRQAASPWTVS